MGSSRLGRSPQAVLALVAPLLFAAPSILATAPLPARAILAHHQGLAFATFLGGTGIFGTGILGVALDSQGSVYVAGDTSSPDFPATPGAFDTSYNGGRDAFVAKFDRTGGNLLYATFLGGSGDEGGEAISVDGQGNAYVTGLTTSPEFPLTPGAFDPHYDFGDSFVTKLDPTGSALVYSTFFGPGYAGGIAIDGAGDAFIAGATSDPSFPTTPGAFDRNVDGGGDAFVSKLLPDGSGLNYSTFIGGPNVFGDYGVDLALDPGGSAYVVAWCGPNFPVTAGAFDTTFNGADYDACVAKVISDGSALGYASYLGTSGTDYGYDIAVDGMGSAYVTGEVSTANFPVTPGAFDPTYNGGLGDAFVSKFTPSGDALAYSTYLGAGGFENGFGIAVQGGHAYVTSSTSSVGFPVTPGSFDVTYNGANDDAFVTELNQAGTGLLFSTFLGGVFVEGGAAVTTDGRGNAFVAGTATDQTFPVTPGAYDTSFNGEVDAFVAKLGSQRAGILLDPESGPPGSTVQITGDGFASGEVVHLSFVDTQSGRALSLGDVTADPSGAFVASEQIPSGPPQVSEWIRATGATSRSTSSRPFRVS